MYLHLTTRTNLSTRLIMHDDLAQTTPVVARMQPKILCTDAQMRCCCSVRSRTLHTWLTQSTTAGSRGGSGVTYSSRGRIPHISEITNAQKSKTISGSFAHSESPTTVLVHPAPFRCTNDKATTGCIVDDFTLGRMLTLCSDYAVGTQHGRERRTSCCLADVGKCGEGPESRQCVRARGHTIQEILDCASHFFIFVSALRRLRRVRAQQKRSAVPGRDTIRGMNYLVNEQKRDNASLQEKFYAVTGVHT